MNSHEIVYISNSWEPDTEQNSRCFYTLVWCDLGQTRCLLLSFGRQLLFDFPLFSSNGKPPFQHFTALKKIHQIGRRQVLMRVNDFESIFFLWSMWGEEVRAIKKSVSRNWNKVEIASTQLWHRFPIARIPFSFLHKRVKVKQRNKMVGTICTISNLELQPQHNFHIRNVKKYKMI